MTDAYIKVLLDFSEGYWRHVEKPLHKVEVSISGPQSTSWEGPVIIRVVWCWRKENFKLLRSVSEWGLF